MVSDQGLHCMPMFCMGKGKYSLSRQDHPEYNTQNITLQDVMARCQASRKGGQSLDDGKYLIQ